MMDILVKRLNRDLVGDLFHLHRRENDANWCYCVAWWVESWDGWSDRTAQLNRNLREDLFNSGHYDGYLLYRNQNPIGWSQVGPRDQLRNLVRQYKLNPDSAAWAVTCFFIKGEERGRGLAKEFIKHILTDLRQRGVRPVLCLELV